MPQDRDETSGQFTEKFETADFLEAVETLDTPTTTNVAEAVGCSYNLAYRRLTALEDDGDLRGTAVGGSFLWSVE